jgi:hypothetical protein
MQVVWILIICGGLIYLAVQGWFRFQIYLLDYLGIDVVSLILREVPINDIPYEEMRRKFKEKKVLLRLRENRLRQLIVREGLKEKYFWMPERPVLRSAMRYIWWLLYSLQLKTEFQSMCRAFEGELFKLFVAERMFGFNINYIED